MHTQKGENQMKTKMLIILLILAAILLTASTSIPKQSLTGTLGWTRSSICGLQDYVSTETMEKVYLTGLNFPSHGELSGCSIRAEGFYLKGFEYCHVFSVQSAILSCPTSIQADR
jgi:hypothetical protein